MGEDHPNEERLFFRDLWEDETQRDAVLDCLEAYSEVSKGRLPGL
jgi:hypothetical protein